MTWSLRTAGREWRAGRRSGRRPGHRPGGLATLAGVVASAALVLSTSGCTSIAGAVPAPSATPRAVPLATNAATMAASVVPDRIPVGLVGRPWLVGGPTGELIAGTTGSTLRLPLPVDELPLAVAPGYVASTRSDGAGSVVIVRAVPGGRVVATVARPEVVLSAGFAGASLVFGGHLAGTTGRDPGLAALSLADGSVRELIAPRDLPDRPGEVARTVGVSPTGRTVVSGACGADGCAFDRVDPETGAVTRVTTAIDGFPGPVTDDAVIVGDAEATWIAALDLATGARRWTREGAEFQHGYALSDGTLVQAVVSLENGTFTLELIDVRSGAVRELVTRAATDGLTLWPELSGPTAAVLGVAATFADAAYADRIVRAAVVDLGSGALTGDGLAIDLGP